ncbi:MAG: hypothetical protein ACRDVZ_04960, partial [Jiangellaceae bacterium]
MLVDIANPLDFSAGTPLTLFVKDTDSLGEQIQRAFPQAKVVKTLSTMNVLVMVHPDRVPGDHRVFVAGDHADAKRTVTNLLLEFGWTEHAIVEATLPVPPRVPGPISVVPRGRAAGAPV